MPIWVSESRLIDEEIRRSIRNTKPANLRKAGLVVTSRNARELLKRIEACETRLKKRGPIANTVAHAAEASTVGAAAAWLASALGVPIDQAIAILVVYSTPATGAYALLDRARQLVLRRRLRQVRLWQDEVGAFVEECQHVTEWRIINRRDSGPPSVSPSSPAAS